MDSWFDKVTTWLILCVASIWGITFGALNKRVGHLEGKVETLQCSQAALDARLNAIDEKLDDIKQLLREQRKN